MGRKRKSEPSLSEKKEKQAKTDPSYAQVSVLGKVCVLVFLLPAFPITVNLNPSPSLPPPLP